MILQTRGNNGTGRNRDLGGTTLITVAVALRGQWPWYVQRVIYPKVRKVVSCDLGLVVRPRRLIQRQEQLFWRGEALAGFLRDRGRPLSPLQVHSHVVYHTVNNWDLSETGPRLKVYHFIKAIWKYFAVTLAVFVEIVVVIVILFIINIINR